MSWYQKNNNICNMSKKTNDATEILEMFSKNMIKQNKILEMR